KNTGIRSLSSDLSLTASHVETEHRGSSAIQRERRASGEPYWAYSGESLSPFVRSISKQHCLLSISLSVCGESTLLGNLMSIFPFEKQQVGLV
uniref:Uncharacterized protein n=1 Tax=Sinocyclocheilus anshuiensis TaxID=1608454 RepID=A0A671SCA7_9TELE